MHQSINLTERTLEGPERRRLHFRRLGPGRIAALILLVLMLAGCGQAPSLPDLPVDLGDLPVDLQNLPGIPPSLREIPNLMEDLGLPDLSQVTGLPSLEDLPNFQTPPGAIVLNGPVERNVRLGERIPGTDIVLEGISESSADFTIAGLRSTRTNGDSLDYDGVWDGIDGVRYSVRLRIYRIDGSSVRAAGVHQLTIDNIAPQPGAADLNGFVMRFPYTSSANTGQIFPGITYGYAGNTDRGAEISNLPADEYPYRKVGDSLTWQGLLRNDIPAEFNLRMLFYSDSSARVGGTVAIALPSPQ